MDNNQIVKHYHGNPITFLNKDSLMVNATEMAKAFGKRPVDWLKTQSANNFVNVYSKVKNITLADLVRVTKGGDTSGTWLHQDIALEFARWLSPQFAIWCNDRIKELLLNGTASIHAYDVPKTFSDALMLAAKQQKQIEEQLELS